jgi:hypothetical protein
MIDVANDRLDVKVKADAIGHANEDNEFLDALEGLDDEVHLAVKKNKKEKRRTPLRKFKRVSARQQQAVGRR